MTRRTFIVARDRWSRDLSTASKSRAAAILREHPDGGTVPGVMIFRDYLPVLALTPDQARTLADQLHDAADTCLEATDG